MKKKIFIMGSSSFSGASLVNYLLKKKFKLFGSFNKKKNSSYLPYLKNKKLVNFKNYKIDLEKSIDQKKLINLIQKHKPSVIVDFASICMVNESWQAPEKYLKINCLSKIELIKKISKFKFVKKFIYISTPEVFGNTNKILDEKFNEYNPSTPYASSKLFTENLIKNYDKNKKMIIARFSNFYGPGQPMYRLIPKIILSIKKRIRFPLHGNGSSKRNYIFSEDFCEGIYTIIQKGLTGSTYHFSNESLYSVKDVINKTCKLMNVSYKKTVFLEKDRTGKDNIYKLACKKTKKELNWKCRVNLDTGIKKMLDYINNNYKNIKNEKMIFKI